MTRWPAIRCKRLTVPPCNEDVKAARQQVLVLCSSATMPLTAVCNTWLFAHPKHPHRTNTLIDCNLQSRIPSCYFWPPLNLATLGSASNPTNFDAPDQADSSGHQTLEPHALYFPASSGTTACWKSRSRQTGRSGTPTLHTGSIRAIVVLPLHVSVMRCDSFSIGSKTRNNVEPYATTNPSIDDVINQRLSDWS